MQVGWPGLSRAIALTAAVTSAFWVALGAWLFNGHVNADHKGGKRVAAADQRHQPSGLLSGFGGTGTVPAQGGVDVGPAGVGPASAGSARVGPAWGGPMVVPVSGVAPSKLVDTYSQARAAGARVHDAIDILAAEGTPVIAAAPGRIEKLFLSEDGGNTIYVRSGDRRRIFYYAHLAAYAPGLREGQVVRQGQVLGTVGHTGNADPAAPHLHFAVWNADPRQGWSQDALPINPYPLLSGRRADNKPR